MPTVRQLFYGICGAGEKHSAGRGAFSVLIEIFALAVVLLVGRLRGVCAAVHFKIQLADPFGRKAKLFGAFLELLVDFGKRIGRFFHGDLGKSRQTFFQTLVIFEHVSGRTAAAVAEAESGQMRGGIFFIHVLFHGIDDHLRVKTLDVAVRQHGKYLAAVNALPDEIIVRKRVSFAPGDFCGKESVYTAFFQDLRKSGTVTEYIGQPQNVVFRAEFFFHELLSVEKLTDEALAADEIRVGFQPHRTLRLETAFFDACLDLFV